jgi:hypothetical protein
VALPHLSALTSPSAGHAISCFGDGLGGLGWWSPCHQCP